MSEYFEFGNNKTNNLGLKDSENKYDSNYDTSFDINKKNDSHAAIARQISDNSVVLDIGCSSGIVGKILKSLKNCIVDGIEYDKITFEIAKKSGTYRRVYNFSITNPETTEFKNFIKENKKYDYIVLGDVLEHLIDPWNTLCLLTKFLKKSGKIIISLPNIAHLDIIQGLINNKFNYNSVGLLDNTHLRFFTSESFADMIKNLAKEKQIYFSVKLVEKILACPKYLDSSKIYELFNVDHY